MFAPSLKTSLSDWVPAHLLWATCCDHNLLIGNINLCSEVPLLPMTLSLSLWLYPLSLFSLCAALTWRQNKTERWIIGETNQWNPSDARCFPSLNNVEPIIVHPIRAAFSCIAATCILSKWNRGRPEPPVLHNYYFSYLSTRPLPVCSFLSCEFFVSMLLTAQHTCYMVKRSSFFPSGSRWMNLSTLYTWNVPYHAQDKYASFMFVD